MKKVMYLTAVLALALAASGCGKTTEASSDTKSSLASLSSGGSESSSVAETVAKADESSEPETTSALVSEAPAETSAPETSKPVVVSEEKDEADLSSNPNVFTETQKLVDVEAEESTVSVSLSQVAVGGDPQAYADNLRGEDGVLSAEPNADGGVDVVFTEEKYISSCENVKNSAMEIIDGMLNKNSYSTITSIAYNDELTDFYVTVTDQDAYNNSMDSFFKLQVGIAAGMYHTYRQDNAVLTVHMLDQNGNEFLTETLE